MYVRSHNKSGTLAQTVTEVMRLRALRRRVGLRGFGGTAGKEASKEACALLVGNAGWADAGISAPEERTHNTDQEYKRYYG
jgi:hypothetical protein